MQRLLTWLVTIPLALAGCQIGHGLGNVPAGSPTGASGELLSGPNAVPFIWAIAVLVGAGLAMIVAFGGRAGSRLTAAPLTFACLPPVVFVLQEYLEYLLHFGGISTTVLLHPASLLGLVLQLPVGAVAYLLARLLLGIAARVAGWVRTERTGPAGHRPRLVPVAARVPVAIRASVHPGRGPPAPEMRPA